MSEKDQLENLAASLGAGPFDVMLVGDGAGSLADTPSGWFVTLYERATGEVSGHWGGASTGTNNLAELEPFVQAMASYRHVLWSASAKGAPSAPPRVLVVSDSEVTVRCGSRQYTRRANAPLWASLEWFEKKGYRFEWKWVPRNSNPFNERADREAKRVRKLMSSLTPGI